MSYESSYDIGFKPFNHDKYRGKWSHPMDFLFACMGHVIKADSLLLVPLMVFRELGFYAIVPYILLLAICVVPIIFMQSFLGQFSGTGFISVFRIAPLFKGIGYVSLGLNLITLAYYSIFSAIPLFHLIYTLQPTIPWSCGGSQEWMHIDEHPMGTICSRNQTFDEHNFHVKIPSVEFFRTHLDPSPRNEKGQFSWLLMLCTFIVWIMVLLVSLRPVETIGRFVKYSFFVIIGVISLILLRCLFLPSALVGLGEFFMPHHLRQLDCWFGLPWIALEMLGPGWGSILTMASFNRFKTNIYSYSWIMSLAQFGIIMAIIFISMLMWGFVMQANEVLDAVKIHCYHEYDIELLVIPTGLTFLELPYFWSVIFFVMLGSLNLLVVQFLSVMTSVFDEFESLRARKRDIVLGTVGALALFSIYFCSNHGFDLMKFLAKSALMTQMLINLLLILVSEGCELHDQSRLFPVHDKHRSVRYAVVPASWTGFLLGVEYIWIADYTLFIIAAALTIIPWCLIPWYCIFRIMQTSGAIKQRFTRCVRPTDWYPADPLYKQRYEETFSNPESSH